jgi:hypothetical protein
MGGMYIGTYIPIGWSTERSSGVLEKALLVWEGMEKRA